MILLCILRDRNVGKCPENVGKIKYILFTIIKFKSSNHKQMLKLKKFSNNLKKKNPYIVEYYNQFNITTNLIIRLVKFSYK